MVVVVVVVVAEHQRSPDSVTIPNDAFFELVEWRCWRSPSMAVLSQLP